MKRGKRLFKVICLGTPVSKARPRFVRGRVVSTVGKAEKLWRNRLMADIAIVRDQIYEILTPIDRPVIVDMDFWFEAKKPAQLETPHGQKPDKDNLEKLCLDVLVKAGVLKDDSLATGGETTKQWQMKGGVRITISEAVPGPEREDDEDNLSIAGCAVS